MNGRGIIFRPSANSQVVYQARNLLGRREVVMKLKFILVRLVLIGLFVFTALTAAGANEFYKGKTVRFLVGLAPGADTPITGYFVGV